MNNLDKLSQSLSKNQLSSGQFPTYLVNQEDDSRQVVHSITTTYLVCLIIYKLKEKRLSSKLLEDIYQKALNFLYELRYLDPVTKTVVWHFNSFYGPDWEDTSWCATLLFKRGLMSKDELEPLKNLAFDNETSKKGIGVWIRDNYSDEKKLENVFDPIVSLSVNHFLEHVFETKSKPTEEFIKSSLENHMSSLFYSPNFQKFFYFILGVSEKPKDFKRDKRGLFHHGKRTELWYDSPEVWRLAEFYLDKT